MMLKRLAKLSGRAALGIAIIGALLWSAFLTLNFMARLFGYGAYQWIPGALSVVVFTIGAFGWAVAHMETPGAERRGLAMAMAIINFATDCALTVGELWISAGGLIEVPAWMIPTALIILSIGTAANVFAGILWVLFDPESHRRAIELEAADHITSAENEALILTAKSKAKEIGTGLANRQFARIVSEHFDTLTVENENDVNPTQPGN